VHWRVGLLLALTSVLASLLAIEAVGRFVVREPLGLFRPSELLGYEMVPDYRGRHHKHFDFDVEIRTDARGLRVADGGPETPGRIALFLGDSVTFGWGVEAGETWEAQLAQLSAARGVTDLSTVNAGVWGYNTIQELAFLRAGAAGYRPSAVVVGLTSPVTPTRNWYCHELGVITLEPLLPDPTGAFAPLHALLKRHSHVYSFLERRMRFQGPSLPDWRPLLGLGAAAPAAVPAAEMPVEDSAALTLDLLRALRDEAQRLGAGLSVVIFPSLDQLTEEAARPQPAPGPARVLRERLVQQLRAAGIPCLDLTKPLAAYEDREKLYLPRDPVHLNRLGHARSAEAARAFLAEAYPGLF
jgi:lysophospholipase L1-like esterase